MKNKPLLTGLLAAALAGMASVAQAWEPAAGSNPLQVMQAASTDASQNRLADAQDKFSWLYEHALVEGPGEPGVTASLLLPQWAKLARHYPPALQSVRQARERLVAEIADGGRKGNAALYTLVRLNIDLKDPASTRDAFVRFAARDPVLAETAVVTVLPAFVALQEFDLASQYLKLPFVTTHFNRMQTMLKDIGARATPNGDAGASRSFQRHVDLQLARVALVLVKSGRRSEAESLVQQFQALAGPDSTSHHMAAALNGIAPPSDE